MNISAWKFCTATIHHENFVTPRQKEQYSVSRLDCKIQQPLMSFVPSKHYVEPFFSLIFININYF